MGKVDRGVFTFWLLAHYFGRELRYIGYGGTGKQLRDLLHVDDLVDLSRPSSWPPRSRRARPSTSARAEALPAGDGALRRS